MSFRTGYNLSVYWGEILTSAVTVYDDGSVAVRDYDECPITPFGVDSPVTLEQLNLFYETRCFPKERENWKELLRRIGLDVYDPEAICRKTHGVQFDDPLWLQFSDEEQVTYEEVRLR